MVQVYIISLIHTALLSIASLLPCSTRHFYFYAPLSEKPETRNEKKKAKRVKGEEKEKKLVSDVLQDSSSPARAYMFFGK